jgi:hypothetical protein
MLENLAHSQLKPLQNNQKSEVNNKSNFFNQLDKLFVGHNQMMTRILQNGLKIPEHEIKKLQREAIHLKKLYFGLDYSLFESTLLPGLETEYLIMETESLPIAVPLSFINNAIDQEQIPLQSLLINCIKENRWFEEMNRDVEYSEFIKPALVFFSERDFVKKNKILSVRLCERTLLPQKLIVYNIGCNLFSLLVFFHKHKQYFSNLKLGIEAYLKFVSKIVE